jgi:hypothetical protein
MDAEIKLPPRNGYTLSGDTARYTIWSYRYNQTRQIGQNMDNFMFSILLKHE